MSGCPSTSLEVKASSDSLKCVHPEVYHCLRDQVGEKTQKCIKPSWIQKGLCAEYNTIAERLDAKSCQLSRGLCPDRAYLSNNVISYSGCAPTEVEVTTTNTTTSNVNYTETGGTDNSSVIVAVVISLVVICFVVAAVCIIFQYRKRQRTDGNDDNDVGTTDPLVRNQNSGIKTDDITEEEKRKIAEDRKRLKKEDYLKQEKTKLDFFVDDKRYVPVAELGIVKKHIFSLFNVVVVGKPGIGKTSLAWNLCKNLHGSGLGNKTCIIKVLKNDIPEIELDEDEKIVLLLDNFLENASTESTKEKLAAIEQAYTLMLSNRKMVLLFTMSHFDYKRHSEIIQEKFEVTVVHMGESTVDMGKVLEAHGITVHKDKQKRTLKEKQFFEIVEYVRENKPWFRQPVPIGFPLIASIASLNDKFLNEFKKFVEKPTEKIFDFVWKLCHSDDSNDQNRFCTIIYAALKGGTINHKFSHSDDTKLFNSIAALHKVANAVLEIDKILFRQKANGDWQFYHESILRVVLSRYGEKQTEFLVSNCPLHVLLKYCTSKKGDSYERKLQIVIEKIDHLQILISRIKKDTVDIKNHIMWEDERFCDWFSKSGNQV